MNKRLLLTLAFAITFGMGFAFNAVLSGMGTDASSRKRVTGIGGIFFKCKDPQKVRDWYKHILA